jgi:hypothetical protein
MDPVNRAPAHDLPRSIEELDELLADQALRVAGARVVFADYDRLLADFPWLAPEHSSQIDQWLLRRAALISVTQAHQTLVNTQIPTLGDPVSVYRPPRSGRAFLVSLLEDGERQAEEPPGGGAPAGQPGLLALKGVGVPPGTVPVRGARAHGDGLAALNKIFEEVLHQMLIEAILRHAGSGLRTLPVYGVLDLGFDVFSEEDERWPAGVLVRQAHRRHSGGSDLPSYGSRRQEICLETELLLRRYGMTSATPGSQFEFRRDPEGNFHFLVNGVELPGFPEPTARAMWKAYAPSGGLAGNVLRFEGVNIQTTRADHPEEEMLLDFEAYRVYDRFHAPLLSLVQDRSANWGGTIRPESPHFVQPDPKLALPTRYWRQAGCDELINLGLLPPDAISGNGEQPPPPRLIPQQLCCQLAQAFRAGRIPGSEVRAALGKFVALVTAHLS